MENEDQQITTDQPPKPKRAYKKRASKNDAEKAIANLIVTHRYIKREILKALREKECRAGTKARLDYLAKLQDLEIDFVKQLTAMGYLPKNVQAQSRAEFNFKAVVSRGGHVSTLPVDEKQLREMERKEAKESAVPSVPEDEAIRAELELQYGSSAVQPEPAKDTNA